MSYVENILKKYGKDLLKKKNVVGYSGSLQKKISNGETLETECLRVYVEKKEDVINLKEKDVIPSAYCNDMTVICTDVVEVGKMKALPTIITEPPVKAGASGMNYRSGMSACTLGAIGKSTKEGEEGFLLIIGNNHCIARENKASVGEEYVYPSPLDGGTLTNKKGETCRFVEIKFNGFTCPYRESVHKVYRALAQVDPVNRVDIACAKVTVPHDEISTEIVNIGTIKGKRRGIVGERVKKTGRTTGYTEGAKLIDNDYYGTVQYSRGTATFGPCALYMGSGFSAGGDSSSAILAMSDDNLLSFLFAGSDTHTIGCHYDFVEQDLEVEIITDES